MGLKDPLLAEGGHFPVCFLGYPVYLHEIIRCVYLHEIFLKGFFPTRLINERVDMNNECQWHKQHRTTGKYTYNNKTVQPVNIPTTTTAWTTSKLNNPMVYNTYQTARWITQKYLASRAMFYIYLAVWWFTFI